MVFSFNNRTLYFKHPEHFVKKAVLRRMDTLIRHIDPPAKLSVLVLVLVFLVFVFKCYNKVLVLVFIIR